MNLLLVSAVGGNSYALRYIIHWEKGLLETSSYFEITQLFWATITHFPTKTLTLLRQGVSPNTKDYRSFTPLAYAAALSYSKIAKVLLNNSNDICWNCGTATGVWQS